MKPRPGRPQAEGAPGKEPEVKDKYKAIIDMPHHVSAKRPHMPLADRAAQFAPFAALTGLDSAMEDTARRVEDGFLEDPYFDDEDGEP